MGPWLAERESTLHFISHPMSISTVGSVEGAKHGREASPQAPPLTPTPAVPLPSLQGEFGATHPLEITVQPQAGSSNGLSQGRAGCQLD